MRRFPSYGRATETKGRAGNFLTDSASNVFGPASTAAQFNLMELRLGSKPRGKILAFMRERAIFIGLLLVGLYFPTSANGNISQLLRIVAFLVSAGLLLWAALRFGIDRRIAFWVAIPIVVWLILCTLVSSFVLHDINVSPLFIYSLLGLMLCVKVRRGNDLQGPLAIASITNITLGIGMLLSETVSGFMLNHYKRFL